MTTSNSNLPRHFESEIQQPPSLLDGTVDVPRCLIYSNHPLAYSLIRDAICTDSKSGSSVRPFSTDAKLSQIEPSPIVVIDACSVENWAGNLERWRAEGGRVIVIISPEIRTSDIELQMLYLGVSGVLTFGDKLVDNLPKAIHAVEKGHLWIRREVLNTFVQRTSGVLRNLPLSEQKLTSREKEIVCLLQRKLSNQKIAQRLAISERTAKFHVSNILRKLNVANRRELLARHTAELSCPDWLLREQTMPDSLLAQCGTSAPLLTPIHARRAGGDTERVR